MLAIVGAVILLPVLAVLATWTQWDERSAAILRAMLETVLPDYAGTSLVLCLMVGTAGLPHLLTRYYTTSSVATA